MTIKDLYKELERLLPPLDVEGIDSDGVHTMPFPDREVNRVLIALDPYEKAVNKAISGKYDLLVTHHPLFWGEPVPNTPPEVWYNKLLDSGVASFSFHIRLDRAKGGVNDALAKRLGLGNIRPFDDPEIAGLGRVGELSQEMTEREFALFVSAALEAPRVRYTEFTEPRMIKTVAVVGGAASDELAGAVAAGADALVGGEFKHHAFGYAAVEGGRGICLVEAGHYHTEAIVCARLAEMVSDIVGEIVIDILPCDPSRVL